jgi:cytochrome c oxidase assembly factor CtaG
MHLKPDTPILQYSNTPFAGFAESWTSEPWIIIPLLLAASIYFRGWWRLHRRLPWRFPVWRLIAFQGGLLTLFLALASPLHSLAELLLQFHMIQHLLLMMVIPPLLLLGAPILPLLRGLPRPVLQRGLGPFFASTALQRLGSFLTHPLVCLLAFTVSNVAWHVPSLYELALSSEFWHDVQHVCFLGTGLLFWWPVVQPWPSRLRWPRWTMIPYLLFADIQNTALSAFLIFSERVLYPTYAAVPRLWGISALDDQAAAGAIMWVPGSVIFLIPVAVLAIRLLDSPRTRSAREKNNFNQDHEVYDQKHPNPSFPS